MIEMLDAGALKTIQQIQAVQGGVLRTVLSIDMLDGGVLKGVFLGAEPLSAYASPAAVSGFGSAANIRTNGAAVTVVSGRGPFTYAWSFLDGDSRVYASTPAFATTTFLRTGMSYGDSETFNAVCTVTDTIGQVAVANVAASFTRFGGGL